MNVLLWVLQILAVLLYGASGVLKIFFFDEIRREDPSFGELPREAWTALGVLELACVVGLIVPAALRRKPGLTVAAAALLALESLVFLRVHLRRDEVAPVAMVIVLGLLMAFLAYGRWKHPVGEARK